jgi:type I restriction enzyme R subunit
MSNFNFLRPQWPTLHKKMLSAEARVFTEPVSAASYCRLVLEECIHLLYEEEHFEKPFNNELVALLGESQVRALIPNNLYEGLHIVRRTGNNAAHYGNRVTAQDAKDSIKHLFGFLKWFALNYSKEKPELPGHFDDSFIPKIGARERALREQQAEFQKMQEVFRLQVEKLEREKEEALEKAKESQASLKVFEEKQKQDLRELHTRQQQRRKKIPSEFTEAETRKQLIDIALKEAGWFNFSEGSELEYPVSGMPVTTDNPRGNGFVDYVLWGDNGKPLALVEAKRTSADAENGRHQAFLYADCIEKIHGVRPVIFYTNGYETFIWDDCIYSAPRIIYGFYTKDELQWSIQRRETLRDIRKLQINTTIAGRPYQKEAIQRVAEAFVVDSKEGIRGNKRRALLVMATGSGKTRTAAALVDVLVKSNWVKRVLFLADRNALVTQAKNSFGEHLPELSSIDLTKDKENDTTRLVFSTYPTMMNRIDGTSTGEERTYGVGHFDLIIVDEAHRSIYNRYKAIFDYFDAMVVGLTATPKDGIDLNTYEHFDCANGDPTFMYTLKEAVPTYLKTYRNMEVGTKFLNEGIRYKDLSEDDKRKYEDTFRDGGVGFFPEEINSSALNKWLFNKDTVNKVLDAFMENGLKIEGGDKIGRSIIFAANQPHADFIFKCFTERYADKPSGFIAVVHNKVSHAQSLIESFCDQYIEKFPQIAISVDMMDTGIDAPRVLNLIFFKPVRSFAKFWQMIGRGTRLCPNVFGPGLDKQFFDIFDVCGNFEFFDAEQNRRADPLNKPLTQQIFDARLQLTQLLKETGEPENIQLAVSLLDLLHHAISNLDTNRFQVKMKRRQYDEFKKRSRWNNLTSDDIHVIGEHLSVLPIPEAINENARRFDLMMLKLQIAKLLMSRRAAGYEENLVAIAEALGEKYTIPAVMQSRELIESMKDPRFYEQLTQMRIEEIRVELRDLVQYLEDTGRKPIYTDIQDDALTVSERESSGGPVNPDIYRRRVENFLRENKHHITIAKLQNNQPITIGELNALEVMLFDGGERGTREDFENIFGKEPLGVFVRSILGLEEKAAQEAFSEFLKAGNLNAGQMNFVQKIISFLTRNGTIDPAMLFEAPFTDINDQGLLGVFDDGTSHRIVSIVEAIKKNAEVG